MLIITTFNLTALFVTLSVLYDNGLQMLWIAVAVSGVLQTVVGLIFLEFKAGVLIILLLYLQLVLIAVQMDGIINVDWLSIMMASIVVGVFLFFAGMGMIVNAIYRRCKLFNRFPLALVGQIYTAGVMLSIAANIAVIVLRLCVLSSIYGLAAGNIGLHLCFFLFICNFRTKICLYMADAQLISIIKSKIAFRKITGQESELYRLSSHWFTLNKAEFELPKYSSQLANPEVKCVACLSESACLVWMPCGHRTACEICGKYLMDHARRECLLCKKKCEEIYHLASATPSISHGPIFRSDYLYTIVET
jgi:hypothetical protein